MFNFTEVFQQIRLDNDVIYVFSMHWYSDNCHGPSKYPIHLSQLKVLMQPSLCDAATHIVAAPESLLQSLFVTLSLSPCLARAGTGCVAMFLAANKFASCCSLTLLALLEKSALSLSWNVFAFSGARQSWAANIFPPIFRETSLNIKKWPNNTES